MTPLLGNGTAMNNLGKAALRPAVLLLLLGFPTSAFGQMGLPGLFGNADAGREVAARHCAQCHALDAGEPGRPLDAPPSFAALAALKPARGDLIDTLNNAPIHVNPPPPATRFLFSSAQIDDLLAYIESLAPAQ